MDKMKLTDRFGMHVFDDRVMRERLPKETYLALQGAMRRGGELSLEVADVVASAMKDWAIEQGATHYAHWFQPLGGLSAEKHEAFLSPLGMGGAITEFSGRMLVRGEADGSSFPTGGLRQVFEARGYTVWDCTSPAFLKSDASGMTLCIPTAFCSWGGEALDEKTPLLRSMRVLSKHALRLLHLFGDHSVRGISPCVGPEQEYFLVDQGQFQARTDLRLAGHTLFGARPPKCQELSDHYNAIMNERIVGFMRELDEALWKMGVPAKTQHNEAAPAQHELACVYASANIASDHNQIVMETLRRVAAHHGLRCLLDEKPFAYINGSGKHNNWSIATDDGQNVFEPGDTPYENAKFLVFLCAVIRAVDRYAPLLRLACASANNDRRLGGHEAPPAILSIYLGESIQQVLRDVAERTGERAGECGRIMDFGVPSLPKMYADSADRNRTAPFAFTGNKFELRMLGASMSVSFVNTILNTIVAESLDEFASRLESADDFDTEIQQIITDTWRENGRILFEGDGYSQDWYEEARRRGLANLATTVDCVPVLLSQETVDLFGWYGVYSESELRARYDVLLEQYQKTVTIDARVMVDMARREIFPAVSRYASELAEGCQRVRAVGLTGGAQETRLRELLEGIDRLEGCTTALEGLIGEGFSIEISLQNAARCRDELLPAMDALREVADRLEKLCDRAAWPFPTYFDLLHDA